MRQQLENSRVMEPITQTTEQSSHAVELTTKIKLAGEAQEDSFLDLCDLLLEAQEHMVYIGSGYTSLGQWIESLNIGVSSQQATYHATIGKKCLDLGVDRMTMKKVKVSKLRVIMSLSVEEHGAQIRELLETAESSSVDELKAKVRAIRSGSHYDPDEAFMTVKFPQSAKEVIDNAIEKARAEAGENLTNGVALEHICADYLAANDMQSMHITKVSAFPPLEVVTL